MEKSKINICVITGSRADYGILKPLCKEIFFSSCFSLKIIATGSHLSEIHGYTVKEIENDFPNLIHKVEILLANSSKKSIIKTCSLALIGISELLELLNPDLVIVLGDRYEIMMAAFASMLHNIPIAHIHGGEISEGSLDDKIRHSITKLSNLHFVSCDEYEKRVIQLGEKPKNVFNVGALGLDNLESLNELSRNEIYKVLNINIELPKMVVVTIHPETVKNGNSLELSKNFCRILVHTVF